MTPDRRRVSELLDRARGMRVAERQAFLAAACADDQALRTELEALLGSDTDGSSPHGSLGSASDAPAGGAGRPGAPTPERLAAAFAVFRDYRARQDAGTAEPVEALLAAHAELRDDLLPLLQPDGPSGVAGASLARSLLERALDLPAAERAGFLDRACGGDIALREDVEQLLARAPNARPDPPRAAGPGDAEGAGGVPAQIGPYRILSRLGEGGMGTVYKAERRMPVRQLVALKVIKPGMDSKEVLARFEFERRALAAMSHSNVAKVLDAGATDRGQPYFVMELVEGIPLTEYCDKHRLPIEQRLDLFGHVCAGVQHAHQKGVVHRDLKPGNVLVVREGDLAVPKILDFGIAKATNRDLLAGTINTEQDQILGTPEYMAPEQAAQDHEAIDTRADVYSLGVILYELLAGELPFPSRELRRAGWLEIQRRLREDEPPRPSARLTNTGGEHGSACARNRRTSVRDLARELRGDLDWVVLKAMAKEPERRYGSPNELAQDLARYLHHQPVVAGPPSARYRLRKFVRRYRAQVLGLGAVLLGLIAGIAGIWVGLAEARRSAQVATERADEIERQKDEIADRQSWFERLQQVVRLRAAREHARELYPAWPGEPLETIERWLATDARLVRESLPDLRDTVVILQDRALPQSVEEIETARHAHPDATRLEELRLRLDSLRRARAAAASEAVVEAVPLPIELATADAGSLNYYAWSRVGYESEREIWGEEPEGLAAARRAAELLEPVDKAHRPVALEVVLDTLAWAWFAVGDVENAITTAERVREGLGDAKRASYDPVLARLQAQSSALRGDEGRRTIAQLEDQVQALERWIDTSYARPFAHDSDRFLFETLCRLIADIETFVDDEVEDVERRREWAARIEDLSIARHRSRWDEARQAILRADGITASTLYRMPPIDLKPQLGLVPIGMNPVTKLWEFYHLRSAWDPVSGRDPAELEIPRHDPKTGHITVTDDTGIVFVLLPGGRFAMGAQRGDPNDRNYDKDAAPDESPVCDVTLSPFFLARHELTQGQWHRLATMDLDPAPSYHAAGNWDFLGAWVTLSHPVEHVDWMMCETLLGRYGLALPTEAQWEYGCRAGTTTPWWTGGERDSLIGAVNLADRSAKTGGATGSSIADWPELDDGFSIHAPVDTLRPNAWGLHHVHGNVAEWTRDHIGPYFLQGTHGDRPRDGQGPAVSLMIHRGGAYDDRALDARSAARGDVPPEFRGVSIGLRAARARQL
ncbi:MAG: protein kinase [Planctomycetes bacterium]|nr:protein kinase [Planctomycetota bacterium]